MHTHQQQKPVHAASLTTRAFQGGGFALLLVTIFLFGVKNPDPSWHKLWMLRPLIIVSLAGATGGIIYYLFDPLRSQGGVKKWVANILNLLIYVVGLWMGFVLGFVGTYWH